MIQQLRLFLVFWLYNTTIKPLADLEIKKFLGIGESAEEE